MPIYNTLSQTIHPSSVCIVLYLPSVLNPMSYHGMNFVCLVRSKDFVIKSAGLSLVGSEVFSHLAVCRAVIANRGQKKHAILLIT